jgi:hypothetical protein
MIISLNPHYNSIIKTTLQLCHLHYISKLHYNYIINIIIISLFHKHYNYNYINLLL